MRTFHLIIQTPEHPFFDEEAQSFVFETVDGEICILGGHAPFVSVIRPCSAKITDSNGKELKAFISDGFVEVTGDSDCYVFAQSAEWPDEIDVLRAEKSAEKARKKLDEHRFSDPFMVKYDNLLLLRAKERLKIFEEENKP